LQHKCDYDNNDKFSWAPGELCEIRRRCSTAERRAQSVSESVDDVIQNRIDN